MKRKDSVEDLEYLSELAQERKISSVIDRCYRLKEISAAHRYVEKGHKPGNVVITGARPERKAG